MAVSKADEGLFASKYGHFSEDGFEYIITDPETPRPWTNVISNGDYGLVVSQAGGGFSWRTHVSLNRLTRWNQDLVRDDWGKWLYLRDLDSGEFRSLAYQPVQAPYKKYQARHGLGYSVFEQETETLRTSWTLFAAKDQPLEIWIAEIENTGSKPRRLELASYMEWNLGSAPDVNREFHKIFIDSRFDPASAAIMATKTLWEVPSERAHWNTEWPYLAFHSVNEPVSGWDTSKDALIGRHGSYAKPKGINSGKFTASSGRFQDASASLATQFELAPGQSKTVIFLLGMVDRKKDNQAEKNAQSLIKKYGNPDSAGKELQKVKQFWKNLTGLVQIETPEKSFDTLVNIWLKYQAISGHLWARTGYYQQSGAYGFRDQLQTSQVWLALEPQKMLDQILLHAGHQFQSGKVLHWWHPLTDKGLETEMVDDLLWLPFMLLRYLHETNDFSVLQLTVPFYDGGSGTLQDHCLRAIEVTRGRFSERGLPLIGAGDWCDGFSAVGLDWKGESVWLGFFFYDILKKWSELLERQSPLKLPDLAADFRTLAENLKTALNNKAWNGRWYIAATKDDGTALGDPSQKENQIYLMSQTWAVMTGVADEARSEKITDAIIDRLESDNGFQLFSPAYSVSDPYIGYLTRYAPGLRENGGVYTHASTWGVLMLAQQKRSEEAFRIFSKMNPIHQSVKDIERYQAEPYVLPGNVDGRDSQYYGRAGWTWYTGSAGWLFSIAHEWILGVRPTPAGLLIDPAMPRKWKEAKITRRFRGAVYHILIRNPHNLAEGKIEITVNGVPINDNLIPPMPKGEYQVEATLVKG